MVMTADEHNELFDLLTATIGEPIARLAAATERQAIALELIVAHAFEVDPAAPSEAVDDDTDKRDDQLTDAQEELYAAIELLEEETGKRVPPEAYKRLGLKPPTREDDPETDDGNDEEGSKHDDQGQAPTTDPERD